MKSLKRLFCKAIGKKFFLTVFLTVGRLKTRRGIGVWDTQGKLFARLLASQKTLADGYVEGALQLVLPRGYLILAEGFEQYAGLSLNFNSPGVLPEFPLPRRYNFNKKSLIAYTGSVVIPFRLKVDAARRLCCKPSSKRSSAARTNVSAKLWLRFWNSGREPRKNQPSRLFCV